MSEPERSQSADQHAVPERAQPWVAAEGHGSARLPVVHRTEVSGLPVFWSEAPGPFTVGLVFRVGRADERATHSGISHLVEHLALPARRTDRVELNGGVAQSTTWFWASGDRAAALDLLRGTAAAISCLPERLETERGILLTEAARRGDSAVGIASALRFGPSGYGLVGYPEFGLRWLGLDEAPAWAAERFTPRQAAGGENAADAARRDRPYVRGRRGDPFAPREDRRSRGLPAPPAPGGGPDRGRVPGG